MAPLVKKSKRANLEMSGLDSQVLPGNYHLRDGDGESPQQTQPPWYLSHPVSSLMWPAHLGGTVSQPLIVQDMKDPSQQRHFLCI